jgi:thiol-disulfide isomerase/thioredoxin
VIFAVILMVCMGLGFYLTSLNHEETSSSNTSAARRTAPVFTLKDHAGAAHALREGTGKITVVHFWAAWCPPCLQEIPELVEFAEHLQNERLQVVAISMDEKWEDAEKVLSSAKLPKNMISLLDGGSKVSDAFGTYQFPESYLVSAQGKIIAKWVGAQGWTNPKFEALIRQEISRIQP